MIRNNTKENNGSSHSESPFLGSLQAIAEKEGLEIQELAQDAAHQLSTLKDVAQKKMATAATAVDDSARKRPWIYVGSAAAVGFIAGFLLRSRPK